MSDTPDTPLLELVSEPVTDTWSVRLVILFLGLTVLASVVGGLVLAQGESGLGQESGERDHGGTQPGELRVLLVASRDPCRGLHRIEAAGADLVGS